MRATGIYRDGGTVDFEAPTAAAIEAEAERRGFRSYRVELSNGTTERLIRLGDTWVVLTGASLARVAMHSGSAS